MKVQMTHEDIMEACREWLENHYGVKVTDAPSVIGSLKRHPGDVHELQCIAVTYENAPKPGGGPYRGGQ